ncbi:DUF3857 domain-containing protein [Terriglobus roseus]|nr:DUF3857 domain-containing protein [Terriglobus roseus]
MEAQSWFIPPTQEELHMTSAPEAPDSEAIILNRDELDDDDNHMRAIYFRIKILTEKGLELGDVELDYDKRRDSRGNSIGEISARTVQPDGTIVPFTGKPFDKVLRKDFENSYSARVFSLPAVKVGRIIEYRYTVRWDDHTFFSPNWIVQTNLYLRKGHFTWKPTNKELIGVRRGGRESISERLVWAKSLPAGTEVKLTHTPTNRVRLDLDVASISPFRAEEFMPPIRSSRYHVFFYYTPYYDSVDFWNTEIKYWSSDANHFATVSDLVRQTATTTIAGATGEEEKARKLYAFTMTLENTDYTRQRSSAEDKAEIKSAEDVLKRKRGSSNQIAKTYIALARAAGLQASSMIVTDRSYLLLDVNWQDFEAQLTDEIAVLTYGGAQHYLDPGSRYCPFGHLEWDHTLTGGVLQDSKDKTKMFLPTPSEGFKFSHTSRVADVQLEQDGHMTGTVTLTYEGSPALRWRHVALRNDEAEVHEQMKKALERWMPGGTEVKVTGITGIDNGEVPLKVTATVDGHVGNAVGSRVMLPVSLFEAGARPTFPHEKRDQAVYFEYAQLLQDAVRYKLPPGFTVESAPTKEQAKYENLALYALTASQTPNSITLRRDLTMGDMYFPLTEYQGLRTFYGDFEAKDHGSIVLKRPTEKAAIEAPVVK